ncbi:MAG: hypothetical protein GKS00_06195 [Alphaproteobacteria bacterium]|nr:hypothetical protein [Alphaproteobacteria bacterium]
MKVKDQNGAGIRHEGAGLTIRNSYFHDGQQGILGTSRRPGDVILIEDSEFARLGIRGRAHPMYFNKADKLIIRRSFIHDCLGEGNCVKSRSKITEISCSVIASMGGNSSWEIDLSNGGRAEIRNNIIQQGPKSVNRNIVGFAMETGNAKRRNSEQMLIFERNIVINDHSGGGQFLNYRKRENTKLVVKGNTFIGPGKLQFKDKNNEYFRNRQLANLKPYPALPSACKK